MEWALFISSSFGPLDIDGHLQNMKSELQAEGIDSGDIKPSRLYFGHETCQRGLPSPGEVVEAAENSRKRKMDFTLVTPYVTERGLHTVTALFREMVRFNYRDEVVCNDWGVFYLLRREFPSLKPVLGRLLNKMLRDPRISDHQGKYPEVFFQPCPPAGRHMNEMLAAAGVKRAEADYPIPGFNRAYHSGKLKKSLYIPYGIITTGRICLLGSWGLQRGQKFRASTATCSGKCRHYRLFLGDAGGFQIIQSGNSVFYRQSEKMLQEGLSGAGDNAIDRIVYQAI